MFVTIGFHAPYILGTTPPAVDAGYIQGLLAAHPQRGRNRRGGRLRDYGDDDENHLIDWEDEEDEEDEEEPRERYQFRDRSGIPHGRNRPPVMRGRTGRGGHAGGQQIPRNVNLRELMMRDIDPNDYETLLALDEKVRCLINVERLF